ncbi:hypothetical protein LA03_30755 [Burkholderia gladioli]|uniref:ribbon-helix-helix domain-containing protein n=1 Tax=Burkholderia gladioli TaxID=28095 RepID=UPI00051064F7|nr:ribbon-helix-helix domain-containing protein [Burkholderia gladioli]KGE06729.1 hypothetical protein LA03_30755 [Burkholderia gladioli]
MQKVRMTKVTVLLPQHEFARLDSYCDERGFKKSTLIARLIRDYLDSEHFPNQEVLPLEVVTPSVSGAPSDSPKG